MKKEDKKIVNPEIVEILNQLQERHQDFVLKYEECICQLSNPKVSKTIEDMEVGFLESRFSQYKMYIDKAKEFILYTEESIVKEIEVRGSIYAEASKMISNHEGKARKIRDDYRSIKELLDNYKDEHKMSSADFHILNYKLSETTDGDNDDLPF